MIDDDNFDFDINEWFNQEVLNMTDEEIEYERQKELEMVLGCCESCNKFISIMGEAGLCKLNDNNCICKNPSSFIDMFDEKCEKWEISEKYSINLKI